MMNLILIAILIAILVVIAIGFSAYDIEPVNGAQTECFSDVNDFFREKMKHINDTDFTVVYPCPEFNRNQTGPEDESGK